MRFIEKLDAIDAMATLPPGRRPLASFVIDGKAQTTLDTYLLSKVRGDTWLSTARSLASMHPEIRTLFYDVFLEYLLTCTPDTAVDAAVSTLSPGDAFRWPGLVKLALQVGFPKATPILRAFASSRGFESKSYLATQFASVLCQALAAGEAETACAALRRFLCVERDPREDEADEASKSVVRLGLEPAFGMDPYSLQEFLEELIPNVPPVAATAVLRVLVDILARSIELSIWPDERAARSGYDGSEIWRPAIEDHANNHDYGCRERLVSAVRNLASAIVTSSNSFSEVERYLLSQDWHIFKRMWVHLVRVHPAAAGQARIHKCLFDDGIRTSRESRHEWTLLLSEQFRNLSSPDKDAMLGWMTAEPDFSAEIKHYREMNQGRSPSQQELHNWKTDRWRRKLAIIKEDIPEEWRASRQALCDGLDEVEQSEFLYRSLGGRWLDANQCHLTVDDIVKMSPADLVESLSDWRQKDPYDGPSESGLLLTLRSAGKQKPGEILRHFDEYNSLRPGRQLALLEGLWEAGNEGSQLDWDRLLETTLKASREKVLPGDRARDSQREASLGTTIIRAIETALNKDHLPLECSQAVFDCLLLFLEHPDPSPESASDETLPERLSSTSLNTPRLIALRCVFHFGRWLRRAKVEVAPEVLQTLEKALQNEPTLAGRSVFGEQMNWLLAHHRPWVEARLPDLFPTTSPGRRAAVWNCFVTMCGASKAALEVFRPEYERAIEGCRTEPAEKPSSDWSPQRGLVRHLCAYYWWGFEPVEPASLTTRLFETATLGLREYVFRYIAQALNETKGELPVEVAKRFMDLADWRIAALKEATPGSIETQELRGIAGWAETGKLPTKWMLQRLREVLRLLSGSGFEHQMLPFDFLASQVESHPALAMGCMYEMTFGPDRMGKNTPPWWGQEDEAKTVLRLALASGNPEVIRQAEEVQDHLLRLGRLEYRNLDPKPEEGETN